ncbi:diacylglycerol kinase [Porticoccus sp. GXU_MW_L64]
MPDFKDRADAARQAMTERADAAKQAMTERADAARQAVNERTDAAREAMQQALEKLDRTGWFRRRVLGATRYSLQGLRACFKNEEAFRTEVLLGLALLPLAYWLSQSLVQFLLMFASLLLILIAELFNSAIEAAVDRIGTHNDEFAKHAKDFGSAAVFMTLLLFTVVWGSVVWLRFWG